MANTVANVTAGKPKITGAIWRAKLVSGLVIPTDAETALDAAFKCVGYISDDGVTNSNSPESDEIRAWGTDIVLTPQTSKPDTWQFAMLEFMNTEVLKAVYGENNVTGDLDSGLELTATSDEQEEACWIIEKNLRGGVIARTVIFDGKITEIDDIVFKDDEPVAYNVTITAMPYNNSGTHKEYMKRQ